MEPNANNKFGDEPSPSRAHPARRLSAPFAINSASRRRSLFARPDSAGDNRVDGAAPSDPDKTNSPSAGSTRIPRPASSLSNQPRFTLSDAYKMAEEEEAAAQGSPSPAPRLWRARREPINGKLQKSASPKSGSPKAGSPAALEPRRRQSVGIPFGMRREDTASSVESIGTPPPRRSDVSENDFDEKVRQKTLSRLGLKITSTAKELVRKTSRSSLNNDSPSRSGRSTPNGGGWLSRRLSSRKGGGGSGSASPEKGSPRLEHGPELSRPGSFVLVEDPVSQPATAPVDNRSPEKSFAWQADADFTAGDLQISDSPRVSTGRSNTRIDEIRALEAMMDKSPPETPELPETPQPQPPRNTRIDELRALEAETALQFEAPKFEAPILEEALDIQSRPPETASQQEDKAARNWKVSPQGPKVDEHRTREIERLSRRALATARLDAIREQAARSQSRSPVQSRSPSPELVRTPSRDPLKPLSPGQTRAAAPPPPEFEPARVPSRELFKAPKPASEPEPVPEPVPEPESEPEPVPIPEPVPEPKPISEPKPVSEPKRTRTRDLPGVTPPTTQDKPVDEVVVLEVPAQSPEKKVHRPAGDNNAGRFRSGGEAARQRAAERAKSDIKPTVGFAGLRRESSGESGSEKRSSIAHSDSDPTERIEREMQLFAPMDNYSERGSLRAPSPEEDDDEEDDAVEETPRPVRVDPMTLPTPRVTGAFVETPLTIRAEKLGVSIVDIAPKTGHQERGPAVTDELDLGANILDAEAISMAKATLLRGWKAGLASRNPRNTLPARGERAGSRSSSLGTHRRARSASRARTPLVNSARPPTVHDDLLQIKQANQYDDSTLDDLADMLSGQDGAAGAWTGRQIKAGQDSRNISEAQRELEVYDRMSKSLETGLLGIRSAKQGIERLEGKVSHSEGKETKEAKETKGAQVKVEHDIPHIAHSAGKSAACPACQTHAHAHDDGASYIRLRLPRLWHRQPRFRFTLLGLLLFLLSSWYLAETAICAKYCKPQVCYAGQPCVWSPDDPTWGNSIPVKLDQWLTGGHGRDYVRRVRPDVEDWVADVWDVATGTDLGDVNISRLSWEQKRQHRRRLMKRELARSRAATVAPEDKIKFDAWKEARLAKERAEGAAQMGYAADQDESMARDEAVR